MTGWSDAVQRTLRICHVCIWCYAGNVFLWERLGAASPGPISPYLAEFVTKKPAVKALQPQKKTTKHLGRRTAGKVDSGRELESILLDVYSAVESVIGLKAEAEQPLMEAGLDSLGKIDVSHLSLSLEHSLYTSLAKAVPCQGSMAYAKE